MLCRIGFRVLLFVAVAGFAASVRADEPKEGNFKASDGVNIHYLTMGDSGPWVVLIHGFSDSAQRMWFTTGIAPALAKNHRVVAIDNRNHGKSDKPDPGGSGRWQDTLELMDLLKIEKAHIHGYSMGGGITGSLLANHPERFITAAFGGSGISETDPDLRAKAIAKDREKANPEAEKQENERWSRILKNNPKALSRREEQAKTAADAEKSGGLAGRARAEGAARPGLAIDLSKITMPVFAINGELDSPNAKTQRLQREVKNFQNVIIPGKTHLTAIAVGGPMPQQYIDEIVKFINSNDPK